jgi:DNA excision repair protein ERCC-2
VSGQPNANDGATDWPGDRDYARFFPYGTPYANQPAAMDRIADALDADRDVLFEGACGTGKTLAALAPALEHARREDRTVVITTNVNQQTRQFVEEARAITAQEPIRATVFRGKGSMCHLDATYDECQAMRDATRDLVDAVDDPDADPEAHEDRAICDHYRQNLTHDASEFFQWLHDGVRTPEAVYAYADREGWCGYELLKEGLDGVDLVICNYHHLLDPAIRPVFFRWLDRSPDEVVAVFDEAHNVEAAAREHATRGIGERTLDAAVEECLDADDPRGEAAANVLGTFRDALVAVYEAAVDERAVDDDWTDVPVANEDRRDDLGLAFLDRYSGTGYESDLQRAKALGRALDREYERAYREGEADVRRECPTETAAEFVAAYLGGDAASRHPIVSVRADDGGVYGRAELYGCLPRPVTKELFDALGASVLMSATLRPFDVLTEALGLDDPETMAYGMTYPEANRRTLAVDTPPLFSNQRDDPAVQSTVAGALRDAIRFTPGNVLCFFPSYAEAERYHDMLDGIGSSRHLDRPGEAVEGLKRAFVSDDDAVMFTSLWGTLAEGVSFDGDAARTVAVVGVPYPYLDDRRRAVQEAYDEAFGDGWRHAVEIPTVRKTRQALGRIVRSPEDVGARLLLDRRYTTAEMGEYGVRDVFPADEREELVDTAPEKLRFALLNFFGERDAYEGSPPEPRTPTG